jgi:hypothetical protein
MLAVMMRLFYRRPPGGQNHSKAIAFGFWQEAGTGGMHGRK